MKNHALPLVDDAPMLCFDGSFDGWLTAVFVCYERGWQHQSELMIVAEGDAVPHLWQQHVQVATDAEKAQRVAKKLLMCMGKNGMRQLLWAFLSEQPQVFNAMFRMVYYQLAHPTHDVWAHYTNPVVMQVTKLIQMVGRERHRMQAFVRFEHTQDDIYFARINPDFNVLPLISTHFAKRYADQNWAIYDVLRGYGIYYQKDALHQEHAIQLIATIAPEVLNYPKQLYSEQEQHYQQMWQRYFNAVNIKARRNPKMHKQMLPKRYWQFLTEKYYL